MRGFFLGLILGAAAMAGVVYYLGWGPPQEPLPAGTPAAEPEGPASSGEPVDLRPGADGETVETEPGGLPDTYEGDVVAGFGLINGGTVGVKEFTGQAGLTASKADGAPGTCEVLGFSLTRQPTTGEAETVENEGARYGEAAQALALKATEGDYYIFEDIHVTCDAGPGKKAPRIVFRIEGL